jgi:hypothetical protein
MKSMFRPVFGAVIALALASAPALSQAITRAYTTFDAKTCKHERGTQPEDYGSWLCAGFGGLPVYLTAGDQRMYVSYGSAKDTPALSQTFPAFNDVYKGTVEWRIEESAGGKARPFATILRWNVMTAADQEHARGPVNASGQVLVVTRLDPGGVCHVGYVDARANANANELARKIADEQARNFKCGKDKRIVLGKTGIAMPTDD